MAEEAREKVFIIPLRVAMRAPQRARADRAVTAVRDFLAKHAKTPADSVRIGKSVNETIWQHGAKSVPKKIRVHTKRDEDKLLVEIADVPFPVKETEKKEKKKEKPAAEKETKKKPEETPVVPAAAAPAAGGK